MPNTTRLCADGSPPGSALIALACQDTSSCSSSAVTVFSSSVTTCATAPLGLPDFVCRSVRCCQQHGCRKLLCSPGLQLNTTLSLKVSQRKELQPTQVQRRQAAGRAWLQGRCGSACSPNAPASCSAGSSGPPPNAAAAAAAPPGPGSEAAAAAMALRRCLRDAQCRS